jgi:hypothetical protein
MRVLKTRKTQWIRRIFSFAGAVALFLAFAEPAFANLTPVLRPFLSGDDVHKKGSWAVPNRIYSENAPLFFKDDDGNEYYLQTFFTRKVAQILGKSRDLQWQGNLRRFKKAKEAKRFQENWSANKLLNLRTADTEKSRKVYTPAVASDSLSLDLTGPLYPKVVQNLVALNGSDNFLRRMGFAVDTAGEREKGQAFVNWLIGDTRNDKLFDIYHSGIALVGPPSAEVPEIYKSAYEVFKKEKLQEDGKKENSERKWIVYVQSNAGMLHAFDYETGEEKWAFIPPNVLENARLRGLVKPTNDEGNPKNPYTAAEIGVKPDGAVVPRFLADGPIVVEDVYDSVAGKFITVLLGSLGLGGWGMYALDITVPEKPLFLWAVENTVPSQNKRETIVWKGSLSNVQRQVADPKWNYDQLEFPMSTPFIGTMSGSWGNSEWVALAGSGANVPFDQASGCVFVIKVLTGEVLQKITSSSGAFKKIFAPVLVLRENEGDSIKTFYVADTQGAIYLGKYVGSQWILEDTKLISGGGSQAVSYSLDIADDKDGTRWLFVSRGDRDEMVGGSEKSNLNIVPLNSPGESTYFLDLDLYRLASPPVVYNGFAFFTTYNSSNGKSRVYSLHIRNRTRYFWKGLKENYIEFSNLRVTGVSLAGGKLAFSVVDFNESAKYESEALFKRDDSGEILFTHIQGNENMLYVELFNAGFDPGGGDFDIKADMPLFWKAR